MMLSPERYVVRDALHQDMAVYSLCLPERWQAWSEVAWNLCHTAHPVTLHSVVYDPASPSAMEYWPVASLYWIDPDDGMLRPNEARLGQVALPPTSAAELMGAWLLPQVRGRLPGFSVLGVQPTPDVIGRFGVQAWDAQPEGVTARIAYEDRGVSVEEEFVAVKVLRTCPTTGPLGGATQINWGFERIASYRAPRGSLDAVRALFWEMNATVQINPARSALAGSVQQAFNSQHQGEVMARYAQMQDAQGEHQAQRQQMHAVHAQNQQRFDERMAAPPVSTGESGMDCKRSRFGGAPPRSGDSPPRGLGRFAKARLNEAAEPPGGRQSSMWEEGWPSARACIRGVAVGRATSDRALSARPREGSDG